MTPTDREKRDSPLRGQSLGRPVDAISRLSLVRGTDRREIVRRSLELIADDVWAAVDRKKRVLIKPNMAVDKNPLAVTHVDAARAVLDFLRPRCRKPIVVAESGVLNTADGFRNNGYFALEKEYGVKVVDLNAAPDFRWSYVVDTNHVPRMVRVYRALRRPRRLRHLARPDEDARHGARDARSQERPDGRAGQRLQEERQGASSTARRSRSTTSCITTCSTWPNRASGPTWRSSTAFESMEGHGPAWGTPLATRLALASRDPLAADVVGTTIMGFDPGRILYLKAMTEAGMGQGDLAKIQVLGAPLDECRFKFKVGETMAKVYQLST